MTRSFPIPYHKTILSVEIPETNLGYYIDLDTSASENENIESLQKALDSNGPDFLENFVRNKHVGWIIEDATRAVPIEDLLKVTGPYLKNAVNITLFLATGTHDGENEENYKIIDLVKKYREQFDFPLKKIIINNCHQDKFYLAGTTKTIKNKIYVNDQSRDVDVFLVFSDMKNHYFAGYSNPIKNFIPGICSYETIERNHALALKDVSTFGHHPLHPDPLRRDNPLAHDLWEAYQLICTGRPAFVLTTITKQNKILWAGSGLLEDVTTKGISKVDELMSTTVTPVDRLIVSCGGYPNDESLYTAQRALELSKNGISPGGEILFIAACANGIGPDKSIDNFFNPLKESIPQILSKYENKYVMYSHKTYKFARLIEKMNEIFVLSELAPELIESIHLSPVTNIQNIVDKWISQDPGTSIGIVTDGNKYAIHVKTNH